MSNKRDYQVFVEYRDDVAPTFPVNNRTYTMTHSDETGDRFVTIGLDYAVDKINKTQDQVYLKWIRISGKPLLYGEVLVDGENIKESSKKRFDIFKREMPVALQAIYVADSPLFEAYPSLMDTPVLIDFKSTNPEYDKLYGFGKIGDYQMRFRKKQM